MRQPFPGMIAVGGVLLATVVQEGALNRYTIFGAQADLPIIVFLSFALLSRPAAGAGLGFLSGLLTGGLSGATLAHYAISRTLAGFALGMRSESELSVLSGALWVAAGSFLAKLVLFLIAPPTAVGPALLATILSAVYNGVVAFPVFALVRRLFRPKVV